MPVRTRTALIAVLCSLGIAIPTAASAQHSNFPDLIPLPTGFQPEGIASGRGSTFYAGSLATGAILKGDLRTGATQELVPAANGPAVGIAVDAKNRVWVAGGPSGEIRVYDGSSGDLLGLYSSGPGGAGFINDLVVTNDAVYATNSFSPVLAVVPLGPGGSLPPSGAVGQLPLVDFPAVPGFNANGIEAGQDGRLIVAHSSERSLYAVDPATGAAERIDVGGDLPFVDGITRQGNTLYAVQNRLNQIAVITLAPGLASGTIQHTITNPDFDVPTTVALFGNATYVVNARFGTPSSDTTEFAVVRTERTG
jgi:sugar lactone lactonase YvrE